MGVMNKSSIIALCFAFLAAVVLHPSNLLADNPISAAPIANVEYVHNYIGQATGVNVPIHSSIADNRVVANVEYLLAAIDKLNDLSAGSQSTSFRNGGSVTRYAVNTGSVWDAVSRFFNCKLGGYYKDGNISSADGTGVARCEECNVGNYCPVGGEDQIPCMLGDLFCPEQGHATDASPKFSIRLSGMAAGNQFNFLLSARGNFVVDWGDGSAVESIIRTDTNIEEYSHTYATDGSYTVILSGRAEEYNTVAATISFVNSANKTKMRAIIGDLGAIFPIINNSSTGSPRFNNTFYNCIGLTNIPSNLFKGLQGPPVEGMFANTFRYCTSLRSIPVGLFSGIQGAPAEYMFSGTFVGCTGLTGSIPEDLFAGIQGAPAEYMFADTFRGCSGLTGSIPEDLFAGIQGAPVEYMFANTFRGCSGLTGSIPGNLFSKIQGAPAEYMFAGTFADCTNLSAILDRLFYKISGSPARYMFFYTFANCTKLSSIPPFLFGDLSGTPENNMFGQTFYGCSGLEGPSAYSKNFRLYELFQNMTSDYVGGCYYNATELDDYSAIPANWK
jgi:hypothetical protein